MTANNYEAIEVTAQQAWFLADYLHAGSYPWMLAITAPYVDPAERALFNQQCLEELSAAGIVDALGEVKPSVAEAVKTVCRPRQWLEWLTIIDPEQILRGVLARTSPPDAVVALRYAQMVTLTPMQLTHSEAIVPIITAGLPPDHQPAHFEEFTLPMDTGKAIDERIGRGADIVETLTALGVPERDAEIMEIARTGDRITVELTAHEAVNGARHHTDVGVNVISTEVGLILVAPQAGEPRAGGISVFSPADPFAVAMAVRELTERLPSGTWFPEENFSI
ncbi:ESX secretion-associated protein EspG [Mycobacterium xenopi]|uniref:ESX secretion-associated protein EspG n=1 Tax=Mycobacterium xenopi TaxID=1789 RepID=UPI000A167BD0|nr:ESX secretion-associated protein EspG [Mycobacterium xenopi]ORX21132.1 secretion protein [Mycobacterium xenopi]SPX94836.1 putative DNA-binding protein [Mycobacterium xenopi]